MGEKRGRTGRRGAYALGWIAAGVSVVLPASSFAADRLGETFTPNQNCLDTVLQTTPASYVVPFDGVITAWSFEAPAGPAQMRLKVGRIEPGNTVTIVGQSDAVTPPASVLSTFSTRIVVQAGDVVGYSVSSSSQCADPTIPSDVIVAALGDPAPGTTVGYVSQPGFRLDLEAIFELDQDRDGFGDETQDACPTQAATRASCVPTPPVIARPDTDIQKGPKPVIGKRKAKFTFTSDVSGAVFECKIDRKPFKSCVSPHTVKKLKDGTHRFQVRAINQGVADPLPAKFAFRVDTG